MKKVKRVIVWFRQDLRVHDNEALTAAIQRAEEVYPIFVFDERTFLGKTSFGFAKTGAFRCQFIIDSVRDLRQSLRDLGLDLIVRTGKSEEVIFDLARQLKSSWVFCNREPTHEEAQIQSALETRLWSVGQEINYFRGKMLYYTQDLPFPITHTPDTFTQFRKEVERIVPVRAPLPVPQKSDIAAAWSMPIEVGDLPTLADFGHAPIAPDQRSAMPFAGGESAGKERVQYYFFEKKLVSHYEETRNGLIGADYSTKFSAYLAQGCLSPKYIYAELQRYEAEQGANKSTYWLFFELLWRDFFRLMGKKYGNKIFRKSGIRGVKNTHNDNRKAFERWATGQTGQPFIDANMRELNATGFMSNRGRQNVASYLVHDLRVNWLMGAEYFESLLVDYDVCSNWGNWNYVAGVGNDPREDRRFNPNTQAQRYDANGDFVRLWQP